MTVSIASSIRSRHSSEKLIPSVPIEIPSLTPIVLKRKPTKPAARTPSFTFSASCSRCILHGLPSYQTLATPTCGFCISSSESPVAYSIACDAPCDFGCVILELNLLFMGSHPLNLSPSLLIHTSVPGRLCFCRPHDEVRIVVFRVTEFLRRMLQLNCGSVAPIMRRGLFLR